MTDHRPRSPTRCLLTPPLPCGPPPSRAPSPLLRPEPGYQAYLLLRLAFTVAPIAFGLDKFFNILVDWTQYLAPWINDILPGNASDAMHLVGVIEIVAGL